MEEAFLHFIWNFQHIQSRELLTDAGQKMIVFHPGFKNTDAGPDFKNAKIKIDEVIWSGNVEIHVNARDWDRHAHDEDKAYDNVILHVVWKNDALIHRKDGTKIPTLELKDLINEQYIFKYRQLIRPRQDILCDKFIGDVKHITFLSMADKVLAERLTNKAEKIFREIAFTDNDWEEITWRLLSRNFGFKTNADPFYELAKSLPLKILKRESSNPLTVEALLFGQAGFLEEDFEDEYFSKLKNEYTFKQKKYSLERRLDKHLWKFLRLRPANFPTLRLAQLASLVAGEPNLFSMFIDFKTTALLQNKLSKMPSAYWTKHYHFGKQANVHGSQIGKSSVENILVNTAAPLLFAYGIHKDSEELKEKSLQLLSSLKKEVNSITKKWTSVGIPVKSAFDSQALIELYNSYCLRKRCLNCAVGVEILNKP